MIWCLFSLPTILIWMLFLSVVCADCPEISALQLNALKDIYSATSGQFWNYTGVRWNFTDGSSPCCSSWAGIGCDSMSNVISVNVSGFSLNGSIPESIGNLSHVQLLAMNENNLVGSIPSTLSLLKNLEHLDLGYNNLEGSISDALWQTGSLNVIVLKENSFTGTVLDEMTVNCSRLMYFDIAGNKFSGSIPASIPASIGNCSSLAYLNISTNYFNGTMPIALFQLPQLSAVDVSRNQLSGPIPEEICSTSLKIITASTNKLNGSIPGCLLSMKSLLQVRLAGNKLTGTLPVPSGDNFPMFLSFSSNSLSGPIPAQYFTKGYFILLHDNHLDGTLPSLNVPSPLIVLDLYNNRIGGTLEALLMMPNLTYGKFAKNNFSGSIQFMDDVSYDPRPLRVLDISDNELTGLLPRLWFAKLPAITSLSMDRNCFEGPIPSEICDAKSLVQLSMNGLNTASDSICTTKPKLLRGYYTKYSIGGELPSCLFSMENLATLYVASNDLHITLPADVKISKSLTSLTLSHNGIRGAIPKVFMEHAWAVLDLSYNQIGGVIDGNITVPSSELNLNVNLLSGSVPRRLLHPPYNMVLKVLDGNFFRCRFDRVNLPSQDDASAHYTCGSNDTNESLLMFAIAVVVLAAGWVVSVHFAKRFTLLMRIRISCSKLMVLSERFSDACRRNEHLVNLVELKELIGNCARAVLSYTAVLFFTLMPLYSMLADAHSKLTYQEAWQFSASFLKGETSASLLFTAFLIFMGAAYVLHNMITQTKYIGPGVSGNVYSISMLRYRLVQIALVAFNVGLMLPINMGYVSYTSDSDDNHFSQYAVSFAVAFTKVFWTSFVVPMTLKKAYQCFVESEEVFHHPSSTMLMAWIVLLNNIVCPLIATALFTSDCFRHLAVEPAEPVDVTVAQFNACILRANLCVEVPGYTRSSTPPFIYSYHCSNSLLQKYASVFIIMALMEAFGKPIFAWTVHQLYLICRDTDSTYFWLLEKMLPSTLRGWRGKLLPAFEQHHFMMVLTYQVAVLLMIGVIFPPIAVVTCIAILSHLYMTRVQMGYLVSIVERQTARKVVTLAEVDLQCAKVGVLLNRCLTASFVFAGIVYATVLIDTIGSTRLSDGFILPIILLCLPAGKFISMSCDVVKKANHGKSWIRVLSWSERQQYAALLESRSRGAAELSYFPQGDDDYYIEGNMEEEESP